MKFLVEEFFFFLNSAEELQGGQQSQRMKFPDFSRFSRPFLVKFQTIYK